MSQTVRLIHHYHAPAQTIWEIAIDYAYLHEVMQGVVEFTGMPEGVVTNGQIIDLEVSLFGKLPKQPYHIEILECDGQTMSFLSSERGTGVKSWLHRLTVETTDGGCKLTDNIEIDAGLMTPLFAMWARYLYKKRHQPRLEILARMSNPSA